MRRFILAMTFVIAAPLAASAATLTTPPANQTAHAQLHVPAANSGYYADQTLAAY
jgi:hypothetical protein